MAESSRTNYFVGPVSNDPFENRITKHERRLELTHVASQQEKALYIEIFLNKSQPTQHALTQHNFRFLPC